MDGCVKILYRKSCSIYRDCDTTSKLKVQNNASLEGGMGHISSCNPILQALILLEFGIQVVSCLPYIHKLTALGYLNESSKYITVNTEAQ